MPPEATIEGNLTTFGGGLAILLLGIPDRLVFYWLLGKASVGKSIQLLPPLRWGMLIAGLEVGTPSVGVNVQLGYSWFTWKTWAG